MDTADSSEDFLHIQLPKMLQETRTRRIMVKLFPRLTLRLVLRAYTKENLKRLDERNHG